jgi:gluconokinase
MMVIVMGVSGAGKSTVGEALATHLGWDFLDADEFHPPENVAKMASGIPLVDADRWPWLDILNSELRTREAAGGNAVLACSALKEAYRVRLLGGLGKVRLVFMHADIGFIGARIATRKHKYMPASLLESQFAALEAPHDALPVHASLPVPEAVRRIAEDLATRGPVHTP